jgi:hypothetical protein
MEELTQDQIDDIRNIVDEFMSSYSDNSSKKQAIGILKMTFKNAAKGDPKMLT